MNLLISNDDGINAEGLHALAQTLSGKNRVVVAAPDGERSAYGHYTSIRKTISYKKVEIIQNAECYSLSGTPVDCVKFGLNFLSKKLLEKPVDNIDMVITGINHGKNLGTDVLYSGTVGAALEALICGYRAVAVSYSGKGNYNFGYAAEFISKNLEFFYNYSEKIVINVNFPECPTEEIKGVKITPLGVQNYNDFYRAEGENGNGYILDSMPYIRTGKENKPDCDVEWSLKNYITVTPLKLDSTDYTAIGRLKGKDISL